MATKISRREARRTRAELKNLQERDRCLKEGWLRAWPDGAVLGSHETDAAILFTGIMGTGM